MNEQNKIASERRNSREQIEESSKKLESTIVGFFTNEQSEHFTVFQDASKIIYNNYNLYFLISWVRPLLVQRTMYPLFFFLQSTIFVNWFLCYTALTKKQWSITRSLQVLSWCFLQSSSIPKDGNQIFTNLSWYVINYIFINNN